MDDASLVHSLQCFEELTQDELRLVFSQMVFGLFATAHKSVQISTIDVREHHDELFFSSN